MTKVCKKCGIDKPFEEYDKNNSRPNGKHHGLQIYCKSCRKLANKDWYKVQYVHGTPYYEKMKEYNRKAKEAVFDHYGNVCACCGETNKKFLSIDHINNDGKSQRENTTQGAGSSFYKWIVRHNFPTDLQTLCFNCNFGRANNKGVCPHKDEFNIP